MSEKFDMSTNDFPESRNTPQLGSGNDQSNYRSSEKDDPNAIEVEIPEGTPLVILYGPGASGKTMALIRLSRYFLSNPPYRIEPLRTFRPESQYYQQCCDMFLENINSDTPSSGTHALDFMLLQVSKDGKPVCNILEAPGEHFFSKLEPNRDFPRYIHAIRENAKIPKIWVFLLENEWEKGSVRDTYSDKIAGLFGRIRTTDNIILLCSKIVLKNGYVHNDRPVKNMFERDSRTAYPRVFAALEGGKKKWWNILNDHARPYDYEVFSAGVFPKLVDNITQRYVPSDDYYPRTLWNCIYKAAKGK